MFDGVGTDEVGRFPGVPGDGPSRELGKVEPTGRKPGLQ